ncbi:hypothetical protein [Tunturibacter empetritectus]|uniref:Uncharacterized protein n=1 Tax=Tunturiibacter lichenicola TaxID=2051959 RepID=A0A7W8JCJ0_9BACT|nr:hypothetical protein [Edaphobacter lichenicola]MBB5345516.1 hypothetical protein [Edaphobacter lichenicola]
MDIHPQRSEHDAYESETYKDKQGHQDEESADYFPPFLHVFDTLETGRRNNVD